jgi:tripeptidyl-peptidase I
MNSIAALSLVALGSCAVLETVSYMPAGWKQIEGDADLSHLLRLSFALREPNMAQLSKRIMMPGAKHLSAKEARELRAPDQDDVEAVQKWLQSQGIADTVQQDDWIHAHTTVGDAQQLLEMELRKFAFEDQDPVMRTMEYSIPDHLKGAISFVHPVANFMSPRKELSQPAEATDLPTDLEKRAGQPCAGRTTPACIRQMYNFPNVSADATSSVRVGIAGFLEEYANYNDTQMFLTALAPDIASTGYNFSVELVNGGENPQDPRAAGSEASLDMQYAMSLGYPAQMTYYSTGGRGVKLNDSGLPYPEEFVDNEPYLEFLEHLLDKSDDEIPHVLSFSYADDELSVPRPYAERVCSMLGLLTARGTSVLGGSGDGGAKGARNSSCRTPDGKDVTMAVFPASCPWVTAVGATRNQGDPPAGAGLSGGGFSQYFTRESWQDGVVDAYVDALGGHLEGYYNASMRATPDISAIGTTFVVLLRMVPILLDGTSASTPLLAAIIGLINDARLKAGKDVLGWLNKHLYSEPVKAVLQDITEGTSYSCKFSDGQSPGGWPAKTGWDAISGLGVPNDFEAFKEALLAV